MTPTRRDGENIEVATMKRIEVEVLGPGCQKCQYVEKIVREVVDQAGIAVDIRHVTDYAEIASRGVLSTPGLVIDGELVVAGRVPTRDQVAAWLGVS